MQYTTQMRCVKYYARCTLWLLELFVMERNVQIEFDGEVPGLAKAFGEVLRKLRYERSMSQQVLATESGLDRGYISLLERGKNHPSLPAIFLLAQVLDCTPAAIVLAVDERIRAMHIEAQAAKSRKP